MGLFHLNGRIQLKWAIKVRLQNRYMDMSLRLYLLLRYCEGNGYQSVLIAYTHVPYV